MPPQQPAWIKYGGGWPRKGRQPTSCAGMAVTFVVGLVVAAVVLTVGVSKWDEIGAEIDDIRSGIETESGTSQPSPEPPTPQAP